MPQEPKSNYVKFSVSVRDDVYDKLREMMKITGLDRSGSVSLAIQLIDLQRLQRVGTKTEGEGQQED